MKTITKLRILRDGLVGLMLAGGIGFANTIPLITVSKPAGDYQEAGDLPLGPGIIKADVNWEFYDMNQSNNAMKESNEALRKMEEETNELARNYQSRIDAERIAAENAARVSTQVKTNVNLGNKVQTSTNLVQRDVNVPVYQPKQQPKTAQTNPQKQTGEDWHVMLERVVAKNEGGFQAKKYPVRGVPHVAYGYNLTREEAPKMFKAVGADFNAILNGTGTMTREQGIKLLKMDLAYFEKEVRKRVRNFDNLPKTAKIVLVDMMYNVGPKRYDKFVPTTNAIVNCRFSYAAQRIGHTALPSNRKPVLKNLLYTAARDYSSRNQNAASRNGYNSGRGR